MTGIIKCLKQMLLSEQYDNHFFKNTTIYTKLIDKPNRKYIIKLYHYKEVKVMKKRMTSIAKKTASAMMKLIPVVLPVVLMVSSNSTASLINGQPEAPKSLRNYRKF